MDEANFSFVIVDADNLRFENFKAFWSAGQVKSTPPEPCCTATFLWQCLGAENPRCKLCCNVTMPGTSLMAA